MKIGVTAFLTEKSGNPGAIAAAAEHAGFESFWVAEHLVIPAAYTTYYPRSRDGKVPESTLTWPIHSSRWRRPRRRPRASASAPAFACCPSAIRSKPPRPPRRSTCILAAG